MPNLYLSPSTQEWNYYVIGGSEEDYMNQIADAMEPWLRANGINTVRNQKRMTAADSIQASNSGRYVLHLALHSNAAPEGAYGTLQGSEVFYSPYSPQGQEAAAIIAKNLRTIYPGTVSLIPDNSIGEIGKTRAPAVFLELAYHDNPEDALWIRSHIQEIAQNLVNSLTEYFGLPFLPPVPPREGQVVLSSGHLNIRSLPSRSSRILASAYQNASLTIWNEWQGWLVVEFDGVVGWAAAQYVVVDQTPVL